jgi:DNA ligase D-like protein (predicted ligase)
MLATLVASLPDSRGWVFERKFDGIRALALVGDDGVRLYSRNKLPLNDAFPSVADALARLPQRNLVLDGEIIAAKGGKVAGFQELQRRTSRTKIRLYLYDVLFIDGEDVRERPWRERRRLLRSIRIVSPLHRTPVRTGEAESLRRRACESGWEGLIAKRADAPYRGGRSRDWLKLKCLNEQEFVVGGYTDPKGSRLGLGALLIGTYTNGELRYAGEVGTGFTMQELEDLGARLRSLETDRSPFADYPRAKKGQRFVRPKLVVQVAFSEWTRDGKLRHPRFLGVRRDKRATEVVRELPVS